MKVSIAALVLLTLTALPVSSLGSDIAPNNYEYAGSLPNADAFLEKMRGYVGTQFWVRKPTVGYSPKELFCDSKQSPPFQEYPLGCPEKRFGVKETERFTIEDVLVASISAFSWFKIRFDSGKTAYLSASDFRHNLYADGEHSVSLYSIDFVEQNSGWIFTEDPETVFKRLRTKLSEEKEKTR